MKKFLIIAMIASLQASMYMPLAAYAIEDKTDAQPKQFKSFATKNKISDDYKYGYLNIDWWDQFNDPVLSDYIVKALEKNHDLKVATLNVETYYQNVKAQFADQLPQIGVGFAPAYLKMPDTTHSDWSFAAPGIVNYEADIFLKNRDKTKSVKKLYEASKFDERAAYISVASAVGSVYLNIIKLDKMIELQEDIVSSREQIYNLMLKRNEEGITSTSDTISAHKSFINGQTDLVELKKQRSKLLNQLAVLTGESPANAESLKRSSLDSINYNAKIPAYISSEVIMQRPDYLKAEKMVEKAGIDVRIAKKEFLPTINLSGLAIFNASDLANMFTTKNMLWALGGAGILPLFTGGKRVANLRLKKTEYEKVLHNYYQTNLTAIQEVNDSLVAVRLDKEKMDQTLKQANLESDDYRYNELKFNEGVISKLDLLQFKESLLYINQIVAQQKAECMVDYISLYKATGSKL